MNATRILPALTAFLFVLGAATAAHAQPTWSMGFSDNPIGLGSSSRVEFAIDNDAGVPGTDAAFVLNLPAGVTIADAPMATSSCLASIAAPAGGSTISVTIDRLGGFETCTLGVNVTPNGSLIEPETFMFVSGDLTSSLGNSGPVSADLGVVFDRPGITASFSPSSIPFGGRSTLTYTLDNSANASAVGTLSATLPLPEALRVADPPNLSNTCDAGFNTTVTAEPGGDAVTVLSQGVVPTLPSIASGSTCTISFDVSSSGSGTAVIGDAQVTADFNMIGFPTALLTIEPVMSLYLLADVIDDPITEGGSGTVRFTLASVDRSNPISDIGFSLDLDAALTDLAATGLPLSDVCGVGSQVSGTSTLTLTGGILDPGEDCTFDVTVQVPSDAGNGRFDLTTSDVTGTAGGRALTASGTTTPLFTRAEAPFISVSFDDDVVGSGEDAVATVLIENPTAEVASMTGFIANLDDFLAGVVVTPPANGFCGASSSVTATPVGVMGVDRVLTATNIDIGAGATCTFDITFSVPRDANFGTRVFDTGPVNGQLGLADSFTADAATANLTIVTGPSLNVDFIDGPYSPGDTATLQIALQKNGEVGDSSSNIAFTIDLDAALTGLTATGLPLMDGCGAGSMLTGTSTLSFTGGSLEPGDTCTMDVVLQIPAGASAGDYPLISSDVTATVRGEEVITNPASTDLPLLGLVGSAMVIPDPLLAGSTATLEFSLDNLSATEAATAVTFSVDIDAGLPGLVTPDTVMTDVCGAGSSLQPLSGNFLIFTNGSLAPGASCTFAINLQIPVAAPVGDYSISSSAITAQLDGAAFTADPMNANFSVTEGLLLSAEFTDGPGVPGGEVTMEVTIAVVDTGAAATDLEMTIDLDDALMGLAATGLPLDDVCGAGSALAGTDVVTLTGGTLASGSSCTFPVPMVVPTGIDVGTIVSVTTGDLTGTLDGLSGTALGATAETDLRFVEGSMSFAGPVQQGDVAILSVELDPYDVTVPVGGVRLNIPLEDILPGATIEGVPLSDVCGDGSTLDDGGSITLTGGSLDGGPCMFDVDVRVPEEAAVDVYAFQSSEITSGAGTVGERFSTDLTIIERMEPDVGPDAGDVGMDVGDTGMDAGDAGMDADDVGSDVGVDTDAGMDVADTDMDAPDTDEDVADADMDAADADPDTTEDAGDVGEDTSADAAPDSDGGGGDTDAGEPDSGDPDADGGDPDTGETDADATDRPDTGGTDTGDGDADGTGDAEGSGGSIGGGGDGCSCSTTPTQAGPMALWLLVGLALVRRRRR